MGRGPDNCTEFIQICWYMKQHSVQLPLQIISSELEVDTRRHGCRTSFGQLIRIPVNYTANGLWLVRLPAISGWKGLLQSKERAMQHADIQKSIMQWKNITECEIHLWNGKHCDSHVSGLQRILPECSCERVYSHATLLRVYFPLFRQPQQFWYFNLVSVTQGNHPEHWHSK